MLRSSTALLEEQRGTLRMQLLQALQKAVDAAKSNTTCGCRWSSGEYTQFTIDLSQANLTFVGISRQSVADSKRAAREYVRRSRTTVRCTNSDDDHWGGPAIRTDYNFLDAFNNQMVPFELFRGLCLDCVRMNRSAKGEGCRIEH